MKFARGPWSSLRWRTRAILWLYSCLAGLAVVAFAKLADLALSSFFSLAARYPLSPLLLGPLVGGGTVWLTCKYFSGAEGSGIPQVIAATRLSAKGQAVQSLVSLRIAFGKILLGTLALTGGFSAGREGPSVQVAASILHSCKRFLPHSRAIRSQDLILAGGAAGVAAAFNTPLAGIVFAVEELGRRLEARTSGVLMSAIILSGLVAIALLGNYNYFGHIKTGDISLSIVEPILLSGITCGLLGGGFSKLLLWPQRHPEFVLWRLKRTSPILFAASCGLVMALIGLAGGGISFGSGYAITEQVVSGELLLPWHAPITRYLATLVSYFSGIPGGIFAPALAVGAAIGSTLSPYFAIAKGVTPLLPLCMAAFLAAVTQAPITSAIIVMEMIDGHGMVLSLMAVALIAKAVSARMGPELYQRLAQNYLPASQMEKSPGTKMTADSCPGA